MAGQRNPATARPPRAASSRIERDLLGELAIPAAALWGIHTARAVRNLSFSGKALGHYADYVRALAIVKRAAAAANRDAGVLSDRVAGAIQAACDALIAGEHLDQFPVDVLGGGGSIAINMNLNEVIAALANRHLGGGRGDRDLVSAKGHANASQSTVDVCHTAARIAALDRWDRLRPTLARCAQACAAKAAEFRPVMTVARTCLQDAAPIPLGEIFGAYAAGLRRRIGELDRAASELHRINLGGTALGDGAGAPRVYRRTVMSHLSRAAGRRMRLRENLYDAAQNIDDLVGFCAQLAMLAEVLIKVAQDIRLLASGPDGGLGEIKLPAVQEGSSFFPDKLNPVVAETLLQCCFQVLGCERAARLALEQGELNLNVFEASAAINLLDAMEMTERAVRLFVDLCLEGIAANEGRCRQLASLTIRQV